MKVGRGRPWADRIPANWTKSHLVENDKLLDSLPKAVGRHFFHRLYQDIFLPFVTAHFTVLFKHTLQVTVALE